MKDIYYKESVKKAKEPTELELFIRKLRLETTEYFEQTHTFIQKGVDQAIDLETRVGKFMHPQEKLVPNAAFVLVAGFAGLIVTKNKSLVSKALVPLAFSVASFPVLFPKTSLKALNLPEDSVSIKHLFTK